MLLALKLVLTPLLIMTLSLTGRKWGHTVSGWLAGLPLNSGPISFLFALQYGTDFTATAAVGSMGGMAAIAAYAATYTLLARRVAWFVSMGSAIVVYFVVVEVLNVSALSLLPTLIVTIAALGLALRMMPPPTVLEAVTLSRWDLPVRLIIAILFVLVITALGNILGPRLSGLVSTFPIFATILTIFAQRQHGPAGGTQWLRGLLMGIYGTVSFYLVIGLLVTSAPIGIAYVLAIAAALGTNAVTLRFAR